MNDTIVMSLPIKTVSYFIDYVNDIFTAHTQSVIPPHLLLHWHIVLYLYSVWKNAKNIAKTCTKSRCGGILAQYGN